MIYQEIIAVIASYLFGSIPFGLIISKIFYKIDVRKHGSGNIGATNVARVCSKPAGILVFLLDFYKAIFVLIIVKQYLKTSIELELFVCFAAILGHVYSIFLKFKGGKAVSSSFACILVLFPLLAISLGFFWVAIFAIFRTVSIASVSSAVLLIISSFQIFAYMQHLPTFVFLLAVSLLILYRHISNIKDLQTKLKSV